MADDTTTSIDTADVLAVDAAVARSTGSDSFGVLTQGFVPKSFARLLAEKLALARALLGDDLDLGGGSVVRKLLELSALEDARTWAALGTIYDNSFVASATGDALSRLGDELGLSRPHLEATGTVMLKLQGTLPDGTSEIDIPRGARLLTPGGHHVATTEPATLSAASLTRVVGVAAFYPGPEHNLDPSVPGEKIDRFNALDERLQPLFDLIASSGNAFSVAIEHTVALTGGELYWPDARYRQLLLRAPRSTWRADAIEIAASLVPGVRQVQVRDAWGGLDINQSIFGNFNFIERLFGRSATSAARTTSPCSSRRRRRRSGTGPTGCASPSSRRSRTCVRSASSRASSRPTRSVSGSRPTSSSGACLCRPEAGRRSMRRSPP